MDAARALLMATSPFLFHHSSPHQLYHRSTVVAANSPSIVPQPKREPSKFRYQDVFPSSLPLHRKNPHVIHRQIRKLASENKLRQALIILDYLYHRGIPVNPTTFSSLLTACARAKSLKFGRQIHAHIRTNNLGSNEFIVSKLVQMYSACNSPEDARKVLDGSGEKAGVYGWNGMLRGNVVGGKRWNDEVLKVFDEMRDLGIDLNSYTYSCMIKSVAGSPNFRMASKLHALLIKEGFLESSVVLQTSVTDMYFKCKKIVSALKMFDEIPRRDIVGWGAVIAGFTHNGLKREAVEYLRWMISEGVEPNSVIIVTVLPAISECGEMKLGKEVHGFSMKRFTNYSSRHFIHTGLIDMYCKCGDIVSARRVFYGTRKRNTVLWTAMMSGYATNGRLDQGLRSIIWMQQEGVKPDVVSVATALPICGKLRLIRSGKELHAYALKLLFLPNVSISTSLMTLYSTCRNLVYSKKVFDTMRQKNIIAWTAMVDCYLRNDLPSDALNVFRSMQLSKHRPDSITMGRALNACGRNVNLLLGKEVHGQVLRQGFDRKPDVSAEIITMYGKHGEIELSKRVFDVTTGRGSLTWTSIIEAHRCNSLYKEALRFFHQMLSCGFVPNHFTFNSVLSICKSGNLPDEALNAYTTMVGKYNLRPSTHHLNSLIDIFTIAGRTEEAARFRNLNLSLSL